MAAKKNKPESENTLAPSQQKAAPVPPPEDGPRQVGSPVTFFGDPKRKPQPGGVRDFSPHPTRLGPAGNDESSPQGEDG